MAAKTKTEPMTLGNMRELAACGVLFERLTQA